MRETRMRMMESEGNHMKRVVVIGLGIFGFNVAKDPL